MITIPGKIPVHIHTFFWLLILMIGWINTGTIPGTLIWAVVILISIIAHEFGHALTANAFGQKAEISLIGLGGVTTREGAHISKWKEFLIVLNGPLVGFFLFFLITIMQPSLVDANDYIKYGLNVGIQVNLFWTILNLLPILPLDGGHLLRIFLDGLFGLKGVKAAIGISLIFALLLGIYFIVLQQLLMGAILFMFAFESYQAWNETSSITIQDTDPQLQTQYHEALKDADEGRNEAALKKFDFLRDQTKNGVLFIAATQESARILTKEGNYKKAYDLLAPVRNKISVEYLVLLQNLAYRLEEWEHAAQIGTLAYQKQPSMDVALINSMAFAIMGQAKEAVGWLRCVTQLGYSSIDALIHKREFDAIRQTSEFQTWVNTKGKN